ncbi:hypothetical protein Tco_1533789 [Tanacetum coccineum]
MNTQEILQAAARDEKWVSSAERVKISSTNIILETTVPQKEETFQVQFWTILDIYPREEGVDFTDVPDDDTTLTFLIDLGYKGSLNRHTKMFVDHMHQPWRTLAAIINKCLSGKLEYGHPIPDVMLTDAIKCLESYQMFIKYSTNQIPPKKSRGKGSKGKKTDEESQETIDVFEESEPKPEPAKKKTASRRVVKKKVTLSADDNIISDDPDAALELAKSISQTKAEEVEAARKVHATHARIITESIPEFGKKKSGGRSPKSIVIQDTPTANIMQALKESKKTSRRLPSIGGSNKGTGSKLGVPDESIVVSATSSEGTGAKPGVPNKDKDITEEKKDEKDGDADDEGDDHVSDTQDADDEDVKTKSDEDDIYKYKIRMRKDEDKEMKDAEVEGSDKGDEEITDAAKEEAEKTLEAKDDTKKTKLPPSSSSLSVSSETINLPPIPEIVTETPVTIVDPSSQVKPIISTIKQTTTPILTPTIRTDAPTVTTAIPESNAHSAIDIRVTKLEKDVSDLKNVDHSSKALAVLQSYVPTVIDSYLDTNVRYVFQKELQKHTADLIHKYYLQHLPELTKKPTPTAKQESEKSPLEIIKIKKEQAESQKNPQFNIKSTDKAVLKEYDLKSALYQFMHAKKYFNRNLAYHQLYHALMEALNEDENVMDKGAANTVKDHKRKHDDDEDDDDDDHPAGSNQGKKTKRRRTKESKSSKKRSSTKETTKGKTSTKGSKIGKSALEKEQLEELIAEVIMDDAGDDVAHDDNQPQTASKPKTLKTLNPEWFRQPPRPPTPDPEWNKRQVVLDQPTQPWFKQLFSTIKDPLTFNDLMATPIEFSKYCFNALTDKLDWNNPEGDRYLFDLSKPLPLQGPLVHRTVAADYFFNNDLKYLKTSDPEITYTTSITKTKAARYEIKGIKDMVPILWSTIKHAYDKDALMGIKHWGERRKLWYRSQVNKSSKQNVYSTKAILGVKSVSVKKLHGYGHLEEIVVKRSNQQLYTFKEGDFVDLHLNDIEDMLLLAIQHKLFHLDRNVIVDFIVALRMFKRSLILKRRVEDLQLSVKSYQKKLNITKPQKTFPEIEFKEPYTPSYDPLGIVYEDLNKQKRVLRADELYMFSDGTLKSVRDEIHHRVLEFRLDYNTEMPKRKWTIGNRKRSGLMVELIDKMLRERKIIKNLERLVGARELEMDYKLMTRTV